MVEIEHLYKIFDGNEVLHDISCRFEPGKTNLIIGQSGSGKTVLMKCLIGLYEADKGSILYDNRDFSKMSKIERKIIRQEMGVMFQGGALFDSMTVEENVKFPLIMLSELSNKEKNERVDFCLERVQLGNSHKLFPSQLSGGMKKRVGIVQFSFNIIESGIIFRINTQMMLPCLSKRGKIICIISETENFFGRYIK